MHFGILNFFTVPRLMNPATLKPKLIIEMFRRRPQEMIPQSHVRFMTSLTIMISNVPTLIYAVYIEISMK